MTRYFFIFLTSLIITVVFKGWLGIGIIAIIILYSLFPDA